ncbi:MAG: DUF4145 domain-containing protein [Flavobacteriales bacterium]|nr:DUF4145 domain-containing protein [Flavobacteriales bacterium]
MKPDELPYFYLETLPHWTCPTCNEGSLELLKDEVRTWETGASMIWRELEDWDPDWRRGTFHLVLKCSRDWCNELVVSLGTITWEENGAEIETVRFTPAYFHPPLKFIKVPEKAPHIVHRTVRDAEELVFADPSASGNKIRIAVEQLMNHYRVRRFPKRGKRRAIPLHLRLAEFGKNHPEEAEMLTACKWIGNVGSHDQRGLTFRQVMDGLEILEYVMQELFDDKAERIKRRVKEVNRRRGLPPRKRTRIR